MAENKMERKNYIPQIAEMLGLEIGEKFDVFNENRIIGYSPYYFDELTINDTDGDGQAVVLGKILNGEYSIKKRSKHILNDVEKRYLENVLRPFKDMVKMIRKVNYSDYEYIKVSYEELNGAVEFLVFPNFETNSMYKGMKADTEYSLEELGLFEK